MDVAEGCAVCITERKVGGRIGARDGTTRGTAASNGDVTKTGIASWRVGVGDKKDKIRHDHGTAADCADLDGKLCTHAVAGDIVSKDAIRRNGE